jgi:DNA invertase Pin-like site-specific DNA recombinase
LAEVQLSPGWATYLRVSDEDKQTPERSFAMQRQRIREQLLSPSNIKFKREYRDMLTGTSPKRKDYQQMLADAQAGSFSHLRLYRADRFGRDAAEGLQAATRLIGLGVKLRVASMPSLTPETPDGFFMFLIQMGLAQREVDVLRQRTADGMEAKLRAGGWPHKGPEGYLNKERLVKSNKYERWVELDPKQGQVLREAWDLLLTGRCTLVQICEELTRRGHTRSGQRPWAWTDPKTGRRHNAKNRLHGIFRNAFYAGWVVSRRFGIPAGEIRGEWEPIVTTEEFNRGVEILRRKNVEKSRFRRQFYLLRNFLWVEIAGRRYKMFGSTPSGRTRSYSYYITHAKPNGSKLRVHCEVVDKQIPDWLQSIAIASDAVPAIRELYRSEIEQATIEDRDTKLAELNRRISQLREEELRLGRLIISGKLTEEAYDRLRSEWQEKLRNAEINLADLERDAARHLDDLDAALKLFVEMPELYDRLEEKERYILLQILAKRIIITVDGKVIDQELRSPFAYLMGLADLLPTTFDEQCGSDQVRLGASWSANGSYPDPPAPVCQSGSFVDPIDSSFSLLHVWLTAHHFGRILPARCELIRRPLPFPLPETGSYTDRGRSHLRPATPRGSRVRSADHR